MAGDRARAARGLERRAAAAARRRPRAGRARGRAAHAADARPQRRRDPLPRRAARRGREPGRRPAAAAPARRRGDPRRARARLLEPDPSRAWSTIERSRLVEAWEAALAALPPDWSDLYAELELTSSDHLDRAALLLSPVNPARYGDKPGFRFRVARRFGYGASPGMVRRCLGAWTTRRSRAGCGSCASSPTPIRSRPRARSGTWKARRSRCPRPDLLARPRAGPRRW